MQAFSIFTLGRLFGLIGSTLYSIQLTEVHVLTYVKFGAGESAYHEKRPMSGSRDKIGYLDAKSKDRLHR